MYDFHALKNHLARRDCFFRMGTSSDFGSLQFGSSTVAMAVMRTTVVMTNSID